LLTLLAIKKLQLKRAPISAIRKALTGRTSAFLEKVIDEEIIVFTDPQKLADYRESIGHTDDSEVLVVHDDAARSEYLENAPSPEPNEAKAYLESLLLKRAEAPEESNIAFSRQSSLKSAVPPSAIDPESWERHPLAQGIELHIEQHFAPMDAQEQRELIESIERIFRSRSKVLAAKKGDIVP